MEPVPPALEACSLNHGTTREVFWVFGMISSLPLQGTCCFFLFFFFFTCCFLSPELLWPDCHILSDIYPTCHLLKEPEPTACTRASSWSVSLAQPPDRLHHSPHHSVSLPACEFTFLLLSFHPWFSGWEGVWPELDGFGSVWLSFRK